MWRRYWPTQCGESRGKSDDQYRIPRTTRATPLPRAIRRFLAHLKLLREPFEIVAIRGPSASFDRPEPAEPDEWDALDELTAEDWAA